MQRDSRRHARKLLLAALLLAGCSLPNSTGGPIARGPSAPSGAPAPSAPAVPPAPVAPATPAAAAAGGVVVVEEEVVVDRGGAPVDGSPAEKPVLVLVIHGTEMAGDRLGKLPSPHDRRWADPTEGDTFARRLRRRLAERLGDRVVRVQPFGWDGGDGVRDLHRAARQLRRRIEAEAATHEVHLVGHSHGGSVALHAAGMADAKPVSVVTLGTPILGAVLRDHRKEKEWFMPVFAPPPTDLRGVRVTVIYSPEDGVARNGFRDWAATVDFDGAAVEDTQLRRWRAHLDLPRGGGRKAKDRFEWVFEGVDPLLGQTLSRAAYKGNVANVPVRAATSHRDRLWVHGALHSRKMGTAIGDILAGMDAEKAVAKRGVEPLTAETDHGMD